MNRSILMLVVVVKTVLTLSHSVSLNLPRHRKSHLFLEIWASEILKMSCNFQSILCFREPSLKTFFNLSLVIQFSFRTFSCQHLWRTMQRHLLSSCITLSAKLPQITRRRRMYYVSSYLTAPNISSWPAVRTAWWNGSVKYNSTPVSICMKQDPLDRRRR